MRFHATHLFKNLNVLLIVTLRFYVYMNLYVKIQPRRHLHSHLAMQRLSSVSDDILALSRDAPAFKPRA